MLTFLASLAIFFAAPGPSVEQANQAAKRVYEKTTFQRELPVRATPVPAELGPDGAKRPRRDGKLTRRRLKEQRDRQKKKNSGLAKISSALLWLLTFVVVAVFALWFVREFLGYMPDAEAEVEAAVLEQGRSNAVVSAPLQDARLLAQRAQYGEAIHALLLRTLMELSRTYSEPLAPSLTSREILEALRLSPAAHDALTGLIEAVELCHFRGSAPGPDDYAQCLQHFEVFARAYVKEEAA